MPMRFLITLPISPAENVTDDMHLSVMWLRFAESFLLLLSSEHWFEKKWLNISALCLKSKKKRQNKKKKKKVFY